MNRKHAIGTLSAVAAALLLATGSAAAEDLTATGAERGPSKDGLVPAFAGRQAPQAGWEYGKVRGDFWKHRNEQPLYSIDAANLDKYADKLSPGQVRLIKQLKGYRMDVYPSHRECQLPDVAEQNSKANLTAAKLAANGQSLQSAALPGVPFPQPKNGAEAMLNYETRYRDEGIEWWPIATVISPRPGSSDWIDGIGPQAEYLPAGSARLRRRTSTR